MKERPILFSAPMVRAILAGRETQTRRIVKPQPQAPKATWAEGIWADTIAPVTRYFGCPYGWPGDRLWVRETWAPNHLAPAGAQDRTPYVLHRANGDGEPGQKWRPAIFMRRHSCRLVLKIESVRVERIQAITEQDALAEGVAIDAGHVFKVAGAEHFGHRTARGCFETLWGTINGLGSWAANPFVWVIEFRKVAA